MANPQPILDRLLRLHPKLIDLELDRALKLFRHKTKWTALMKRAMKQDFSVVHMAKDYIALYESILSNDAKVD
mgnify:CR=1 FL=1